LKKLTIIIPTSRNPNFEDRPLQNIKNIINELKKEYELKIVWINFNTKRISESKNKEFEIINFQDYSNAFQVLDEIKPDLIFVSGWMEFRNSAFYLAGNAMKIPVVVIFMTTMELIDFSTKSTIFLKRMRLLFKKKKRQSSNKKDSDQSNLSNLMTEYWFFIKTIQNIHTNILQKLNMILSFPKALLTRVIPPPNLINGNLNLCYNLKIKNKLIESGFVESKIFVMGDPYFDHIFEQIQNIESRKVQNSKIKVLFCPADMYESGLWTKREEDELIIRSIKKIQNNNKFEVALKIHPFRRSKEEYEYDLKKNNIDITIHQNEEFVEFLKKYDVMITYGTSAIALQGIILKKPVLFLHFSDKNRIPEYYDEKVSAICYNTNELLPKIREVIQKNVSETNYEKYYEKYLGKFDGRSSERAANAISNILNEN